jgi:hypothetical protein
MAERPFWREPEDNYSFMRVCTFLRQMTRLGHNHTLDIEHFETPLREAIDELILQILDDGCNEDFVDLLSNFIYFYFVENCLLPPTLEIVLPQDDSRVYSLEVQEYERYIADCLAGNTRAVLHFTYDDDNMSISLEADSYGSDSVFTDGYISCDENDQLISKRQGYDAHGLMYSRPAQPSRPITRHEIEHIRPHGGFCECNYITVYKGTNIEVPTVTPHTGYQPSKKNNSDEREVRPMTLTDMITGIVSVASAGFQAWKYVQNNSDNIQNAFNALSMTKEEEDIHYARIENSVRTDTQDLLTRGAETFQIKAYYGLDRVLRPWLASHSQPTTYRHIANVRSTIISCLKSNQEHQLSVPDAIRALRTTLSMKFELDLPDWIVTAIFNMEDNLLQRQKAYDDKPGHA